jgi:hypothetical protein
MFCLVLPGLTLTAGFPDLRCLTRTTLAFRPPPDYGSGGLAMAVLADAAPCGSVPGRTCKRQWTVPLPAVQQAATAVSACPCRSRRCPQWRPPAGWVWPQAASAVAHLDRRCLPAAPTWPGTQGVCGTGHRSSVRWTSGIAGQVPAGRPLSAADTAAAPLSRAGGDGGRRRPTVHARPPATAVDPGRRRRCLRRQQNLDAGGCPDQGVRRTACCRSLRTTVAVSAVLPALRPPGDGVRMAGVHRGHRRRLWGGCCYRKRSPDRWLLNRCCSHRR